MTSLPLSLLARRALVPAALVLSITAISPTASGQEALDPAAAREHLTQGYKLKQAGQLKDALPHFVESLRLDPKLKTAINLADTEEKLGMLVEAQSHWLLARDKAKSEGDARIKQEAEQRLAALDQRMPRLNIQLAAGVPADAQVFRDDVPLGRVSLATPLPTNPGEHKITVKAPGREDWNYKLKLSEKDNQVLTARVGPVSKTPPKSATDVSPPAAAEPAATAPPPAANQSAFAEPAAPPPAAPPAHDSGEQGSPGTVQRVLGIVSGGLGIASFAVAGLYWKKAGTDIKVEPNGRKLAQDDLLITNVSLVTGSILVTAGFVLYLTAPSAKSSASAPGFIRPDVFVGKNTAVLGASGAF
jgi:hypothetical protein